MWLSKFIIYWTQKTLIIINWILLRSLIKTQIGLRGVSLVILWHSMRGAGVLPKHLFTFAYIYGVSLLAISTAFRQSWSWTVFLAPISVVLINLNLIDQAIARWAKLQDRSLSAICFNSLRIWSTFSMSKFSKMRYLRVSQENPLIYF